MRVASRREHGFDQMPKALVSGRVVPNRAREAQPRAQPSMFALSTRRITLFDAVLGSLSTSWTSSA